MGQRRGLPSTQIPVINSVIIAASLAGGVPAMRGSMSGQLGSGRAGKYGTGPPASHLEVSGSPLASRGVWQSPQCATPTTIYLPRSTELALLPVLAVSSLPFASCAAVRWAPLVMNNAKTAINKQVQTSPDARAVLERRTGIVRHSFYSPRYTMSKKIRGERMRHPRLRRTPVRAPDVLPVWKAGHDLGVNCLPLSKQQEN